MYTIWWFCIDLLALKFSRLIYHIIMRHTMSYSLPYGISVTFYRLYIVSIFG